jgi:hypothetical protein
MEEQPPPLTPQDIAAMQTVQYAELGQPQTVKVFGIMHLILAAYGFGATALGIITVFVGNPFLMLLPKTPELAKQMEVQQQMQDKMAVSSVLTLAMSLATTVLILMAGIKLLRKRRSGLTWSNRYAWVSLVGKVLTLVITFIYTIPIMRDMAVDPSLPAAAQSVMRTTMAISAVGTVIVMSVYPILTLFLLNRPRTKEWFAAQPE